MSCDQLDPAPIPIPTPEEVRTEMAIVARRLARLKSMLRLAKQAEEDRRWVEQYGRPPCQESR